MKERGRKEEREIKIRKRERDSDLDSEACKETFIDHFSDILGNFFIRCRQLLSFDDEEAKVASKNLCKASAA